MKFEGPNNFESESQFGEKDQEVFDGKFKVLNLGKAEGSFKPTDPEFYDRLNGVREKLGLKYIFAPSLAFTKRTASVTEEAETGYVVGPGGKREKYAEEGILRTEAKADGGVIFLDDIEEMGYKPEEVGLAGFNADCPFIVGYESEKRAFFMLHAGLGCLHKTGDRDHKTIFEKVVDDYDLDPKKLSIHVTGGIQKCCYGRNDEVVFPDVLKAWGVRFGDVATEGSRAGQRSMNMAALIFNDLQRVGVPTDNIDIEEKCTCCDGEHWSNVKGDPERNLVLVRPTDKV